MALPDQPATPNASPETFPVSTLSSRVSSRANSAAASGAATPSFFDRLLPGARRRSASIHHPTDTINSAQQDTSLTTDNSNDIDTNRNTTAIRSLLAETYSPTTPSNIKSTTLRHHHSLPVDQNLYGPVNKNIKVSGIVSQDRPHPYGQAIASLANSSRPLRPLSSAPPAEDSLDDTMSTTMLDKKTVEVAPVRSWNDFVLGSASKFALPDVTNTTTCMRRAVINLLYYQTNYCVTMLSMFLLTGILNPREFTLGAITIGVCGAGYSRVSLQSIELRHLKQAHPMVSVASIAGAAIVAAYAFGSVLVFLSGILLPLLLITIHAAIRRPNLERLADELPTLMQTPMASLLGMLGFNIKRYLDVAQ